MLTRQSKLVFNGEIVFTWELKGQHSCLLLLKSILNDAVMSYLVE